MRTEDKCRCANTERSDSHNKGPYLVRRYCQPPTPSMPRIRSGRDMACIGNLSVSLKGSLDSNSPTTPSPRLTATKEP